MRFPAREKSGNFEETGKLGEFQTNVICYFFSNIKIKCVLFSEMNKVFS